MKESDFLQIISRALELDNGVIISLNSTQSDLEGWDSLGHLAILSALDAATAGSISNVAGLSEFTTLQDLYIAVLSAE
jgi:acyl carrier protein